MEKLSILRVANTKELRDTLSEGLAGWGEAVVAVAIGEAAPETWESGACDLLHLCRRHRRDRCA
jgi:CheY-like chemotaxis protein